MVTVDSGGCVRLWETSVASISKSIEQWQKMIGGDQRNLEVGPGCGKGLLGHPRSKSLVTPKKHNKGFVHVRTRPEARVHQSRVPRDEFRRAKPSFTQYATLNAFQLKINERPTMMRPEDMQPKHGKIDPTGAPHRGGGTWAGGTGEEGRVGGRVGGRHR